VTVPFDCSATTENVTVIGPRLMGLWEDGCMGGAPESVK
jgi:hypothetical protein